MTESEKKKRIEEIKREWMDEVEKLPPLNIHRAFNDNLNKPRREIEKKYTKMIEQIINSD